MRFVRLSFLIGWVALTGAGLSALPGCLDQSGLSFDGFDAGSSSTGGGTGSGGTAGAAAGGSGGGTTPTGGSLATGGAPKGGSPATGATTGGGTTGGSTTGGTGGSATGGVRTGGAATGGTRTGGAGGTSTGGASTGGMATGGSGAGGMGGAVACGPVCDLACPQGYVLDAKGCPTCMCKQVCPAIKCTTSCPFGNQKDAMGCDTCSCLPAPPCTSTECGGTPNAPIFSCPNGDDTSTHCSRRDDGTCVWSFDGCTGDSCSGELSCPAACLGNYARDSQRCTTCTCSGVTACDTCVGPQPGASMTCDDGSSAGFVCERTSGGIGGPGAFCSYAARSCPTVPSSTTCMRLQNQSACDGNDSCIWLSSGCKAPALGATGCYPRRDVGCASDDDCSGSRICVQRNVNPCVGTDPVHCASCGVTISLCLMP